MRKLSLWIFLAVLTTSPAAATPSRLPFIQDDYAKANAEAVQRKLPIFVEVWAPW